MRYLQVNRQNQLAQGMLLGYCLTPNKDNKPKVKVAMFSPLVNPKDIEVPLIMKGIKLSYITLLRKMLFCKVIKIFQNGKSFNLFSSQNHIYK